MTNNQLLTLKPGDKIRIINPKSTRYNRIFAVGKIGKVGGGIIPKHRVVFVQNSVFGYCAEEVERVNDDR